MPRQSERDPKFVAKFTKLWNAGTTTSDMGDQLGISKNAVCGLRNRLFKAGIDVPPRPSPIRRTVTPPATPAPGQQVVSQPAERHAASPVAAFRVITRDAWLPWFNRQPAQRRVAIAQAPHAEGCPLRSGGGLWECTCGASQPSAYPRREATAIAPPAVEALPATPVEAPCEDALQAGDAAAGDDVAAEPVSRSTRLVYAEGCQRPIGVPGSERFRYCDAPVEGRGPYCADCRRAIYLPDQSRRSLNRRMGIPVTA